MKPQAKILERALFKNALQAKFLQKKVFFDLHKIPPNGGTNKIQNQSPRKFTHGRHPNPPGGIKTSCHKSGMNTEMIPTLILIRGQHLVYSSLDKMSG